MVQDNPALETALQVGKLQFSRGKRALRPSGVPCPSPQRHYRHSSSHL